MRKIADRLASILGAILVFYGVSFAAHGQQLVPINVKDGDRAVIFVHGLDGDPTSTFTAAGSTLTWGQLMATDNQPLSPPPPLSGFSTYTVDYRPMFAASISIEDIAQQVASLLEANNFFVRYNNIWFITHSLGGLVIKRMIVNYHAQNKDKFIDKITGVFLIAVPSQGAPLAGLAENEIGRFLLSLFGKHIGAIKDLQPKTANTALQIIENDWVNVLGGRSVGLPRVYCAHELEPIMAGPMTVTIVNTIYESGRCTGNSLPFPRNHIDIVKPNGLKDAVYLWVRSKIQESLRAFDALETVSISNAKPLKDNVARFTQRHSDQRFLDQATGLPEVPENIEYEADNPDVENGFRLSHSKYSAPTVADLFEAVSRAEPCVGVKVAPSRMSVAIKISPEVQSCGDAEHPSYVCRGLPCPVSGNEAGTTPGSSAPYAPNRLSGSRQREAATPSPSVTAGLDPATARRGAGTQGAGAGAGTQGLSAGEQTSPVQLAVRAYEEPRKHGDDLPPPARPYDALVDSFRRDGVSYWKFENNGHDSWGTQDATIIGSPELNVETIVHFDTIVEGAPADGKCIAWPGTNDSYAEAAHNTAYNTAEGSIVVTFQRDSSQKSTLVAADHSSMPGGFSIEVTEDGSPRAYLRRRDGAIQILAGETGDVALNKAYTLIFKWGGAEGVSLALWDEDGGVRRMTDPDMDGVTGTSPIRFGASQANVTPHDGPYGRVIWLKRQISGAEEAVLARPQTIDRVSISVKQP